MSIRFHDKRFNMQSSYDTGLKQFLDEKTFKPGLGAFDKTKVSKD